MTQSTFTLAQVISICVKVAPSATLQAVMNAINAETACDNAPQSETPKGDEPQKPVEGSREIVNPAHNETPKPKQEDLAAAYAKIQAYIAQYDEVHTIGSHETHSLARKAGTKDRKWVSMGLSMRKSLLTIDPSYTYDDKEIVIDAKAYRAAKRAYDKQQKRNAK